MRKFVTFSFLILSVFLLESCHLLQKAAVGPEDEIIVVADSVEFQQLQSALDSTFQKIIYTPQPEKLFTLKRVSVNQFNNYQNRKNIIIAAPLNSGSYTSKYINTIIDSSVKKKIEDDSVFVVDKYNIWARDQLVMLLSAPDIERLSTKIMKDGDNLLYSFQKISDKRLYASLYNSKFEQKDIEGKLLKEYGWVIYVQADFQLALDKPQDNFVWLRRGVNTDMERWIFVHWINNASPAYLNADSIRAIRNRMTQKFYTTDDDQGYVVIASDYFTTNEVNFEGKYAILTQGLWELNIKGMGGPFINYTFYDEKTHRIYMLDGSVYAPKYFKRNIIQQMDVTLQSFMTESQLSKDRKQDLLEAAKK